MDTFHLIDPELRPLLDEWPTLSINRENLNELRQSQAELLTSGMPAAAVTRRKCSVPGPAGAPDVPILIYSPEGQGPWPCLYHIHGGGFVIGTAASFEFLNLPVVQQLQCVVVSVDYRLAPETMFPGNVEDCYAGLAWTFEHAADLGIDPSRIAVGGESAGGGLAAALALLARDRDEYAVLFQLLSYPMLDDRTGSGSDPNPHAGQFIWTRHNNRFGWASLLGRAPGGSDVSPYAAVARAEDLSGMPPAYIMTGALDLFFDESLDYARKLVHGGVSAELRVYPGAFHGFDIEPTASIARRARIDRLRALKRAFSQGTGTPIGSG